MLSEEELIKRVKEWLGTVTPDTPIVMLTYGLERGRDIIRNTNVDYLIKYLAKKMSMGYTSGEILPTKMELKGRNFEIILPFWEWKLKNKTFGIVLHNVDKEKQTWIIKVCY